MIQSEPKLIKAYETDASQIKGKAEAVIIPETLAELQEAVRINSNITIRGGGTGLSGGAVPLNNIVIDLSKMNKISEFNKIRKTIEIEAGVILDELNNYLESSGLEFPVQPSSHEVCTLGGMIATNAVGSRAIKHGRTSNWIEWLDIIDPTGKVTRKNKSDISDFFGLEGISGIIYKACLRLSEKLYRTADIIEKETIEKIIEQVKALKRNSRVSMIEFYDKTVSQMLGLGYSYHILVEYESDEGNLSGGKYKQTMAIRDKVYPLLACDGHSIIEDPKLFLDKIPELIKWLENNSIPVFGHISVGILHPCFCGKNKEKIHDMMRIVKRLSGQVSGEHGIGLLKKEFLEEQDKKLIKIIKQRNDFLNKFNVGKVING
jgi:FAD/FMN-containing dehydrogenase